MIFWENKYILKSVPPNAARVFLHPTEISNCWSDMLSQSFLNMFLSIFPHQPCQKVHHYKVERKACTMMVKGYRSLSTAIDTIGYSHLKWTVGNQSGLL